MGMMLSMLGNCFGYRTRAFLQQQFKFFYFIMFPLIYVLHRFVAIVLFSLPFGATESYVKLKTDKTICVKRRLKWMTSEKWIFNSLTYHLSRTTDDSWCRRATSQLLLQKTAISTVASSCCRLLSLAYYSITITDVIGIPETKIKKD